MKPEREVLQQVLDDIFPAAQHVVEVDKEQHMRILIIYDVTSTRLKREGIVQMSQNKDVDGDILKTIRKACPRDTLCVMIDEVWLKFAPEGEEVDASKGVESIPGRKEGIVFSFFGSDWESFAFCEIKRKPLKLLKGEIFMDTKTDGRLSST